MTLPAARFTRFNPWHLVWLAMLLSVLMSVPASTLIRGSMAWDYPVAAGLISFVVATLLVLLLKRMHAIEGVLDDQSLVGVYIIQDNRFVYGNAGLAQIYGYTIEEMLALPSVLDIVADEDRSMAAENIRKRIAGERPVIRYSMRGKRKDGAIIYVEAHGARIRHKGRPAIFGVVRDETTEREAVEALKKSEEQLRHAQKMEAVGQLAGGIAHDFNNLLTVIIGYTDAILDRTKTDLKSLGYARGVRQAADQAADLTRQLLAFSRRQVLQTKVLNLNDVVTHIRAMLERLVGEDIHVVTNLEPNVGHVKADPGQLGQVIMNLVSNARDAMPEGGRVTIESANVTMTDAHHQERLVEPGRYVVLSVSDTGQGMDQSTQARIFEPFFTTKEPGKGTGLGLSTAYGIVKQSGGYIFVSSEIGRGATFHIYLPRMEETVKQTSSAAPMGRPLGGTETVLLVEDEPRVRILARDWLREHGFTVLEARHGVEALLIGNQHRGPIHLLVTDVVMPQMSGPEVAKQLAGLQPDMKVLFMSGYTDHAAVHHGVIDPGCSFLQKPFDSEELLRKVHDVLQGGASARNAHGDSPATKT